MYASLSRVSDRFVSTVAEAHYTKMVNNNDNENTNNNTMECENGNVGNVLFTKWKHFCGWSVNELNGIQMKRKQLHLKL